MNGVADEILKLRFSAGPLQSLYLNQDRVNERFISHLGSISSFTQSAGKAKGGGVDLKIVKADAQVSDGNQIMYSIADPVARALLLREALQAEGVVHTSESATVGQYV